jgi:DNA invertase Pin-like site-specific DNA recombinase
LSDGQKSDRGDLLKSFGFCLTQADDGESDLTLDRPAMNRLMADIESGKVKTVIVASADRIARGVDCVMAWILNVKWTGIRCLSLEDGGKDIRCGSMFIIDLLYDMFPGLSKPLSGSCCPLRKSAD